MPKNYLGRRIRPPGSRLRAGAWQDKSEAGVRDPVENNGC